MSKIRKKDLHLKEDAFVSLLDRSRLFIEEQKRWFIIGGSAIFLIIIIVLIWSNYSKYTEKKAQNHEKTAMNLFFKEYLDIDRDIAERFSTPQDRENNSQEYEDLLAGRDSKLDEALNKYREILENYASTSSGERALYMTGYLNYLKKDYKTSMDHLERYLKKYGQDGTFFIPGIKNIASLHEINGEPEKGLELIEKYLSSKDFLSNFPADSLLLQAGLLLMGKEDYEEAGKKFDLLISEYPDSMLKSEAEKYQAFTRLKVEPGAAGLLPADAEQYQDPGMQSEVPVDEGSAADNADIPLEENVEGGTVPGIQEASDTADEALETDGDSSEENPEQAD